MTTAHYSVSVEGPNINVRVNDPEDAQVFKFFLLLKGYAPEQIGLSGDMEQQCVALHEPEFQIKGCTEEKFNSLIAQGGRLITTLEQHMRHAQTGAKEEWQPIVRYSQVAEMMVPAILFGDKDWENGRHQELGSLVKKQPLHRNDTTSEAQEAHVIDLKAEAGKDRMATLLEALVYDLDRLDEKGANQGRVGIKDLLGAQKASGKMLAEILEGQGNSKRRTPAQIAAQARDAIAARSAPNSRKPGSNPGGMGGKS